MNTILPNGGVGYMSSQSFVSLRGESFEPVTLDNFCNCSPVVLVRLTQP